MRAQSEDSNTLRARTGQSPQAAESPVPVLAGRNEGAKPEVRRGLRPGWEALPYWPTHYRLASYGLRRTQPAVGLQPTTPLCRVKPGKCANRAESLYDS